MLNKISGLFTRTNNTPITAADKNSSSSNLSGGTNNRYTSYNISEPNIILLTEQQFNDAITQLPNNIKNKIENFELNNSEIYTNTLMPLLQRALVNYHNLDNFNRFEIKNKINNVIDFLNIYPKIATQIITSYPDKILHKNISIVALINLCKHSPSSVLVQNYGKDLLDNLIKQQGYPSLITDSLLELCNKFIGVEIINKIGNQVVTLNHSQLTNINYICESKNGRITFLAKYDLIMEYIRNNPQDTYVLSASKNIFYRDSNEVITNLKNILDMAQHRSENLVTVSNILNRFQDAKIDISLDSLLLIPKQQLSTIKSLYDSKPLYRDDEKILVTNFDKIINLSDSKICLLYIINQYLKDPLHLEDYNIEITSSLNLDKYIAIIQILTPEQDESLTNMINQAMSNTKNANNFLNTLHEIGIENNIISQQDLS